ncbi:MAG TPA: hypothetical protein VGS22_26865 [Thermoanaerobaculia bacterium]|jgi:predicted hotdog family 3-hydroxylacyl-ACP dehydratase|nr:hypothetical protein [Thermoanaerobaculia bacterium]
MSAPSLDLGFRWIGREETAEGILLTVEIGAESPAFRGHFPGRPILPAVAQLALIEQGIAALDEEPADPSLSIAEISGLRLRRTVGPGERLTLRLAAANETGARRFEIRSDGGSVSGGTVRTTRKGADELGGAPSVSTASTSALDLETLPKPIEAAGRVPHVPPALLIESLVTRGPSGARGRALISADSPFAAVGKAPSYLGLEIAAQTAALVEALGREGEDSAPRVGYLVAIRQARCFARTLPVGEPLDVVVRFAGSAPPLSIYEILVEQAGRVRVEGTISTWITEGIREGET